jgi:hypothetical protein
MKTLLLTILLILAGSAFLCHADSLYDYVEALDKNFTAVRKHNVIRVSARPRLFEEEFTRFVQDALDKKQTKQQIIKTWIPRQKEMAKDGYVFMVEFDLLNQNLDSGISVTFGPELPRVITLENNKGEKAVMYKYTGDKVSTLDFLHTKRNMVCYFNTKTEEGTPLIRRGITTLKLNIGKFSEDLSELEFVWNVPLWYKNTPRPREMLARFGSRPVRTLKPYKTQVYHAPKNRVPVVTVRKTAGSKKEEEKK